MADDLEQLRMIHSQTLALVAEITANPKPSYALDGQSISWGDYLAKLRVTVDWCDMPVPRDAGRSGTSSGRFMATSGCTDSFRKGTGSSSSTESGSLTVVWNGYALSTKEVGWSTLHLRSNLPCRRPARN